MLKSLTKTLLAASFLNSGLLTALFLGALLLLQFSQLFLGTLALARLASAGRAGADIHLLRVRARWLAVAKVGYPVFICPFIH